MLDDLRNAAAESFQVEETPPPAPPKRKKKPFLGMTAVQRFVLSLALFLTTLIVGALCLLLTGRIYLF